MIGIYALLFFGWETADFDYFRFTCGDCKNRRIYLKTKYISKIKNNYLAVGHL